MSFLTSRLLAAVPGIRHGFGTADEPVPKPFLSEWERRAFKKQVHGVVIAEATAFGQDCGEADGIATAVRGLPISALSADCVPILLARRDGARVAAVHAGWRGTRARILRELWRGGEDPRGWVAAIGPAIGPCCYQVSEELAADFKAEFSRILPPERILPAPRMLDLPAINEAELRELGVSEIEVLRYCTRCSLNPRFASYRRDGSGQRQWAVIARV